MPWYLYALSTPLLYSFSNFIDKFLIDKKLKHPLNLPIIGAFISLLLSFFLILFRGWPRLGLQQTAAIIFAGILLKLYIIPYYYALKGEDASRVVPLFQVIPIIVLSLAWIFLKESMTSVQVLGALVVVGGGIILGSQKIDEKTFKFRPAFWLMLLSSFMYASILVIFRALVIENSLLNLLTLEYLGAGVTGISLLLNPKIRQNFAHDLVSLKSITQFLVFNEFLGVAAQLAEMVAISLVPVALVSILGGTQPIMVFTIGLILSLWFPQIVKEDIGRATIWEKIISIIVIFTGLYFVYLY